MQESLCIDTLHTAITSKHMSLPCTNLFQTRVLQLVTNLLTHAGAISITNLQKSRSVRLIVSKEGGAAVVQVCIWMDGGDGLRVMRGWTKFWVLGSPRGSKIYKNLDLDL